ncbi:MULTISPECIES: ribonuclease domain-containing protein [unclassified Paludibacterium]|uniref:ribonuclease domain-containing protein n=1 Tax=unclassified Paludibacterium TaxID=2618429 RepID=UPI001C05816C|nr:ribonuclease domain-containing protein [Paludibacterium sp. B53371]BEV73014.1 hypothetical protein THUN1379_24960 [Paludibacterium sp. THUN1379]
MTHVYRFVASLLLSLCLISGAWAERCQQVVETLNASLSTPVVKTDQLAEVLNSLRTRGVLPKRYLSKQAAREVYGWQDGPVLWEGGFSTLRGRMLGGYGFRNSAGLLPREVSWQVADLDYLHLGQRGAKRLIYAEGEPRRYLTVDHYRSFVLIPPCQD